MNHGESDPVEFQEYRQTFHIQTASDFFHEVVFDQFSDTLRDPRSERKLLLLAIVLYHTMEWYWNDNNADNWDARERIKRELFAGRPDVEHCHNFVGAIANGTKHSNVRGKSGDVRTGRLGGILCVGVPDGAGYTRFSDGLSVLGRLFYFWAEHLGWKVDHRLSEDRRQRETSLSPQNVQLSEATCEVLAARKRVAGRKS